MSDTCMLSFNKNHPNQTPHPQFIHIFPIKNEPKPLNIFSSQTVETELLNAEFEDIMSIINTIPEHIDADDIMILALLLPLKSEHIRGHECSYALLEQGREMRVHL